MPCSFAARMANGVMFFWHLHVLPPAGDLLYLIRNKVDCNPDKSRLLCLVIRFVRDRYARAKRQEVVSAKKNSKKKNSKKKSD